MKKLLSAVMTLFGLFGVFAVCAASFAAESEAFRVMSFNIRCIAADGENHWDNRKETLLAEITEMDPLVLGVQEATPDQMDFLTENLSEYAPVGVGRDDGKRSGEFSAIFYKKENLELLDSATFWLSETPEQAGSRGWDAACNRVVTWGKFRCKASGSVFVYANTHFDHRGETARTESAKLVVKRAAELTDNGALPFFISGDFNCSNKTEAYKILTAEFADSFVTAKECVAPVKRTYHGYGKIAPDQFDARIDFIFVNDKAAVEKFQINPDLRDGRFPSDHNSIVATLILK